MMQEDERDRLEVLIFEEIEETVGTWLRAIIQRLEKEQMAIRRDCETSDAFTRVCQNRIDPKSEELAAVGPTQSGTPALRTSDGASGRGALLSMIDSRHEEVQSQACLKKISPDKIAAGRTAHASSREKKTLNAFAVPSRDFSPAMLPLIALGLPAQWAS